MLKLFNAITAATNYILFGPPPRTGLKIYTMSLGNGGEISVYMIGHNHDKYRFIYQDGKKKLTTTTRRLLKDRQPIDELRTGIHDDMLTKFMGTHVQFYNK